MEFFENNQYLSKLDTNYKDLYQNMVVKNKAANICLVVKKKK